ncbi:uncharacterized protein APUU_60296A [Aspergillus puulaauensis]|uniref:Uncharacterized protein n=1 Tax=Aspergillus puulaauensis TaxID=1220207 RepID=A0A7R8ARV8_9EURO|nr:uncharacterized protein APUU_60296A [Aspergillus puulaauensis]BCS27248.1 hypothetical protein APUU_60296A [Aspergillus puulaauensis]
MPEDRSRSAAVDGGELVIHRSSYQEALEIGDNVRFNLMLVFTGIFTDHVVDNLPECKPQSKQSVVAMLWLCRVYESYNWVRTSSLIMLQLRLLLHQDHSLRFLPVQAYIILSFLSISLSLSSALRVLTC